MKNSFKKGYEEIVHPDGSTEYKYKAERKGRFALISVLTVPLFLVSCTAGIAGGEALFGGGAGVPIGVILGVAVTLLMAVKISGVRESLTIVPNQGIKFKGNKTLPFSDITTFGITRQQVQPTVHGTPHSFASVYAESGGAEIRITSDVPDALANFLVDQLISAAKSSVG